MRRLRGAFLCFDVDFKFCFEPDGEVVVVNGDLLDQLSDEAFVEFGDFGLLTSDEVLLGPGFRPHPPFEDYLLTIYIRILFSTM